MSFQYVQRRRMQRTVWGSLRLWAWDFLSGLLLFFEIELGPLPAKWRKTK